MAPNPRPYSTRMGSLDAALNHPLNEQPPQVIKHTQSCGKAACSRAKVLIAQSTVAEVPGWPQWSNDQRMRRLPAWNAHLRYVTSFWYQSIGDVFAVCQRAAECGGCIFRNGSTTLDGYCSDWNRCLGPTCHIHTVEGNIPAELCL